MNNFDRWKGERADVFISASTYILRQTPHIKANMSGNGIHIFIFFRRHISNILRFKKFQKIWKLFDSSIDGNAKLRHCSQLLFISYIYSLIMASVYFICVPQRKSAIVLQCTNCFSFYFFFMSFSLSLSCLLLSHLSCICSVQYIIYIFTLLLPRFSLGTFLALVFTCNKYVHIYIIIISKGCSGSDIFSDETHHENGPMVYTKNIQRERKHCAIHLQLMEILEFFHVIVLVSML